MVKILPKWLFRNFSNVGYKQNFNTMKLMKILSAILLLFLLSRCNDSKQKSEQMTRENKAIFLHHSTGQTVWRGDVSKVSWKLFKEGTFTKWLKSYNKTNKTNYVVEELSFPKHVPYGWSNQPYDYYNIWVKNAGEQPYMEEPTLEMLTKQYGLIILKHCYPVGAIEADSDSADIESTKKQIQNYKLQYEALKTKMRGFPDTKFLIWTGATQVKGATNEENAKRTKEFMAWVRNEWDEKEDNIFLWDFYELETEGGLYLKDEYASGPTDSHPNKEFAAKLAPLFGQRIMDVFTGKADEKPSTGFNN